MDSKDDEKPKSQRGRSEIRKNQIKNVKESLTKTSQRSESRNSQKRRLTDKQDNEGSQPKRITNEQAKKTTHNKETIDLTTPSEAQEHMEDEVSEQPFQVVKYSKEKRKATSGSYKAPTNNEPSGEQKVFKISGMPGSKVLPGNLLGFQICNILVDNKKATHRDIREVRPNKKSGWATVRITRNDRQSDTIFWNAGNDKDTIIHTEQIHWKITQLETTTLGVIKGIPDTGDPEGLAGWIKRENEDITSIRQMGKQGTTYLVKFSCPVMPSEILTCYGPRTVYSYIRSTPQCRGCLKFGHTIASCHTKEIRCNKCGGTEHKIAECPQANPKCIHCGSSEHSARDKDCPKVKEQKQKTLDKIQRNEAAVRMRQNPNPTVPHRSYAEVANPIGSQAPFVNPLTQKSAPTDNTTTQMISEDAINSIIEKITQNIAQKLEQMVQKIVESVHQLLCEGLEQQGNQIVEQIYKGLKEMVASNSRSRSTSRGAETQRQGSTTPITPRPRPSEAPRGDSLSLSLIGAVKQAVTQELNKSLSPEALLAYRGDPKN